MMQFTPPSHNRLTLQYVTISFVVVLCALVIGCSSSDNGKMSELEDQLDVAKAARMTAENQLAELRTQIEALMGRAEISPEALAELRTQVEALAGRADITPEDLADLRGQLDAAVQNADVAKAARMTAENQLAELRVQIEELMGRADISPEALAAIQDELEAFTMARMMQQQQEQARLDAMVAGGLEGGLARSPQAAVYATSEADTVANRLPDGQTVFSPSTVALYWDWIGLENVAQPDLGAAYVKSLSSDGAGGFHATFVLDGTEHPVHFSTDDRRQEIQDYLKYQEDSDHYLWAWSDSFAPDDDDWTDGNTARDYHDLHGWSFAGAGRGAGGEYRGALIYGLQTMPDNLPTGSATFEGYLIGEWFQAEGFQELTPGEVWYVADVNLEANLDDGTISGRFDEFRIPSWWTASGVDEPLEGNSIDIPSTMIEEARFAADWVGNGPMDALPSQSLHGFTGSVIGEFYGPAAEEAGGVLSGQRPAMGGAVGELITGAFSTLQVAPDQ